MDSKGSRVIGRECAVGSQEGWRKQQAAGKRLGSWTQRHSTWQWLLKTRESFWKWMSQRVTVENLRGFWKRKSLKKRYGLDSQVRDQFIYLKGVILNQSTQEITGKSEFAKKEVLTDSFNRRVIRNENADPNSAPKEQ